MNIHYMIPPKICTMSVFILKIYKLFGELGVFLNFSYFFFLVIDRPASPCHEYKAMSQMLPRLRHVPRAHTVTRQKLGLGHCIIAKNALN